MLTQSPTPDSLAEISDAAEKLHECLLGIINGDEEEDVPPAVTAARESRMRDAVSELRKAMCRGVAPTEVDPFPVSGWRDDVYEALHWVHHTLNKLVDGLGVAGAKVVVGMVSRTSGRPLVWLTDSDADHLSEAPTVFNRVLRRASSNPHTLTLLGRPHDGAGTAKAGVPPLVELISPQDQIIMLGEALNTKRIRQVVQGLRTIGKQCGLLTRCETRSSKGEFVDPVEWQPMVKWYKQVKRGSARATPAVVVALISIASKASPNPLFLCKDAACKGSSFRPSDPTAPRCPECSGSNVQALRRETTPAVS